MYCTFARLCRRFLVDWSFLNGVHTCIHLHSAHIEKPLRLRNYNEIEPSSLKAGSQILADDGGDSFRESRRGRGRGKTVSTVTATPATITALMPTTYMT